jgi:hypothetical protein
VVGELELVESIAHVVAHGRGTEHKTGGDVGLSVAACDQVEDLVFAVSQLRINLRYRGRSEAGEEVDQMGGDAPADDGLATTDGADGSQLGAI